jgi:hypothetical protein
VECEPGFLVESFQSLTNELNNSSIKIDAMSLRKQTEWDPQNDQYAGFINYGEVTPEKPDTLASEALVFLWVGTRTHCDKMSANTQAQLVKLALEKAAESSLRVWSITTDGTLQILALFVSLAVYLGQHTRLWLQNSSTQPKI